MRRHRAAGTRDVHAFRGVRTPPAQSHAGIEEASNCTDRSAATVLSGLAYPRLTFGHAHGRVAAALYVPATRCAAPGDPATQPRRASHPCVLRQQTRDAGIAAGRCEFIAGT